MLLIDIGNTRIKSAVVVNGELQAWPELATRAPDTLTAWPLELVRDAAPTRVLVANVAGPEIAGELAQFAFEHWGVEAEFLRPRRTCAGMTTTYRDPLQLGVDRWLAALAGWTRQRGAVCVVDIGTALTVDVVTAAGQHRGGLIAPGPELMRRSLTAGTAQLRSQAIEVVDSFADNTADAISLGCSAAVRGLLADVRARLARLARDTTGDVFEWYLTGGGAAAITDLMPWPHHSDPLLVLRGLMIAASEPI